MRDKVRADNEASVVRESAQTDDAKITFLSSFGRCGHAGFDYSSSCRFTQIPTWAIMTMQMTRINGGHLPQHAPRSLPPRVLALDRWADRLIVLSACAWVLVAAWDAIQLRVRILRGAASEMNRPSTFDFQGDTLIPTSCMWHRNYVGMVSDPKAIPSVFARLVPTSVRPAKAGMNSGCKSHRGKSPGPVA